jgi:hypothetical protein
MSSPDQPTVTQESFIVADCGSTNTTAALFDVAAGSYRLIARASVLTTAAPPHLDVGKGVRQAISHISEVSGRELLNERGILIRPARTVGKGVDHFAAVVSAAPPLTALLVGLDDQVSLASARRALSSSYVREIDSFSPADPRGELAQIFTLLQKQPDLIFLVGGTDGGAEQRLMDLVETVSLGTELLSHVKRPRVLFAGNINLREQVRHAMGNSAEVHVADNIRPSLEKEQLDSASEMLRVLYDKVKVNGLAGIRALREWDNYPLIPTAHAFATITRYFAALQKAPVLGVDLGSNSSSVIVASPEQAQLTVRSDLGMGRPVDNLLAQVGPKSIAAWLPTEVERAEIRNYVANKKLFPQTVPMTGIELHLEQAIAREVVRYTMHDAAETWAQSGEKLPAFKLILLRGGVFANTSRPGQSVLMLLDAIQPAGLFSVVVDQYGVLPALGALAANDPLAVVQALEGGVLTPLGWVVAPMGHGKLGKKALTISMESKQIRRLEVEVAFGSIEVLPLPQGQSAEVTLQPERRFDIGFGPGQGMKLNLHGGAVGLVVDARGRPLDFQRDGTARHDLMRQWLWDVGA